MVEVITSNAADRERARIDGIARRIEKERKAAGGNLSPWIYELDKNRPIQELDGDIETDVAVIGAGISGILTAYYVLRETDKRVAVFDTGIMAHGATGNNAGQIEPLFEQTFASLAFERADSHPHEDRANKLALARGAHEDARRGLQMYSELISETGIDIPFSLRTGYIGLVSEEQVAEELEDISLQLEAGLSSFPLHILDTIRVDPKYKDLYQICSTEELQELLQTKRPEFIAAASTPLGIINSALLCEKLYYHMKSMYPHRFALYENSQVKKTTIYDHGVSLTVKENVVTGTDVVVCTNAYTTFEMDDTVDPTHNNYFSESVQPVMGYMTGYIVPPGKQGDRVGTSALLTSKNYTYMTRRPMVIQGEQVDVVMIGGPEKNLEEEPYNPADTVPSDVEESMRKEVTAWERARIAEDTGAAFAYQGLMGYSADEMRDIGATPTSPHVYINSKCNGLGLALAAWGGYKIARQMAGDVFPPSLFDVK